MNIDKLISLREFEAKAIASGKFLDMTVYMNACGTAYCHAGFLAIQNDIMAGFDAAREFLEMEMEEAMFLFDLLSQAKWARLMCSPTEGKARLDYLIEFGRIPVDASKWAEQFYGGKKYEEPSAEVKQEQEHEPIPGYR